MISVINSLDASNHRLHAGSSGLRSSGSGAPQLKSGLPSCIASCLPPDLHHLIYTNTDHHDAKVRVLHHLIHTNTDHNDAKVRVLNPLIHSNTDHPPGSLCV